MSVAVVVDGGASLPVEAKAKGVTVVPMRLEAARPSRAGGRRRSRGLSGASTAAASPGDFLEAIERADEGQGVLVVTVATGLSASHAAARSACAMVAGHHGVALVDSASATAGEGLVALAGVEAAAKGATLEEVARAARQAAAEVRLVAQVASLDELARGGRLPRGVAAASRRAGLRVLFEVRAGQIRPLRPAFGLPAAEARIVAAWRRSMVTGARLHVGALHADARASADRLLAAIGTLVVPATSFVAELSPVMLAHTGPGVSGLAWWWEREP